MAAATTTTTRRRTLRLTLTRNANMPVPPTYAAFDDTNLARTPSGTVFAEVGAATVRGRISTAINFAVITARTASVHTIAAPGEMSSTAERARPTKYPAAPRLKAIRMRHRSGACWVASTG